VQDFIKKTRQPHLQRFLRNNADTKKRMEVVEAITTSAGADVITRQAWLEYMDKMKQQRLQYFARRQLVCV
jgi:uncharacterized protein (DUF1697 family)